MGSHWLIFGRDFTVRTITMETVRLCIFFFAPGKFKAARNTKSKNKCVKILGKSKMMNDDEFIFI